MSISQGIYNIGVGGHYPSMRSFADDIASSTTGPLVGNVVSTLNESTYTVFVKNYSAGGLTILGNGNTIYFASDSNPGVYVRHKGNLTFKQLKLIGGLLRNLTWKGLIYISEPIGDANLYVDRCYIDNKSQAGHAIASYSATKVGSGILQVTNSIFINCSASRAVSGNVNTLGAIRVENCFFHSATLNTAARAVLRSGINPTSIKNCSFYNFSTCTDYDLGTTYCATNRSSGLPAGQNNVLNYVPNTEYESFDVANAAFLRPVQSGLLWRSGALPLYSQADYDGQLWRSERPIGPRQAEVPSASRESHTNTSMSCSL